MLEEPDCPDFGKLIHDVCEIGTTRSYSIDVKLVAPPRGNEKVVDNLMLVSGG